MKKVILITGASRGIGAATARLAAAQGYALCLNYHRQQAAAEALVSEITLAG
ncbi:MAG TPA: SDR family NAD(P)-dependent oxidoreductase, partial [Pseudomonas sp.]|nr:SDR family NAD(P)-dependent oxidoreductase [Pseudomonas sp.]